jgi:hypothetical protein
LATALQSWLAQIIASLADQMPHRVAAPRRGPKGKRGAMSPAGSRQAAGEAGVIDPAGDRLIDSAEKRVIDPAGSRQAGAPCRMMQHLMDKADADYLRCNKGDEVVMKRLEAGCADGDYDYGSDHENQWPAPVNNAQIHNGRTLYCFSCTTRMALFSLLIEELEAAETYNPISTSYSFAGWPQRRGRLWRPSIPYFMFVLRNKFKYVRFYKKPRFTKCDTCVLLRNAVASRSTQPGFVRDAEYARDLHHRHVASEVISIQRFFF